MNKEVREYKFGKLSDANKIRYNLGIIILIQIRMFLLTGVIGLTIIGFSLMLPFFIRYGSSNRIFMMVGMGSLVFISAYILFFVGIFKLNKKEKVIEDFLNKKSKK